MNHQLLNKKWSSYYNWTITYPIYFTILMLIGFAGLLYAGFNEDHNDYTSVTALIFGASFFIIGLITAILPYIVWFIIASDSLAKTLGWNRILFNVLNLLAIFSFLYFITVIFFWIKIKEVQEDAGYNTSWNGKITA